MYTKVLGDIVCNGKTKPKCCPTGKWVNYGILKQYHGVVCVIVQHWYD